MSYFGRREPYPQTKSILKRSQKRIHQVTFLSFALQLDLYTKLIGKHR